MPGEQAKEHDPRQCTPHYLGVAHPGQSLLFSTYS